MKHRGRPARRHVVAPGAGSVSVTAVKALGCAALSTAAACGVYALSLRPRHLRWGASDAEIAQRWPGDELVPRPGSRAVRAVTVNVAPERVWPWIMQVGRERGGFYSYTWLENLIGADIHNVDRLIPGLPERRPGETVWMGPREKFKGMARMVVATLIPRRAMVLVPPPDAERIVKEGTASGVWSFVLDPVGPETTRFLMVSLTADPRLIDFVFWEPAHFVMERKMMLTIKRLAETS